MKVGVTLVPHLRRVRESKFFLPSLVKWLEDAGLRSLLARRPGGGERWPSPRANGTAPRLSRNVAARHDHEASDLVLFNRQPNRKIALEGDLAGFTPASEFVSANDDVPSISSSFGSVRSISAAGLPTLDVARFAETSTR